MIGLVLISLALGIASTIGLVALLAILARRGMGVALAHHIPALDRGAKVVQALAGLLIVGIGLITVWPLV
jgi:hypothetical protein